jgi:hypothetical protein
MSFLKKLFGSKKEVKVMDEASFWNWFQAEEKALFKTLQSGENIEPDFLDKVIPKLQQLNSSFYTLAGMDDDETAELIISAEGDIKTFVFVEDLVAAAPVIKGWKFTALKPAIGIANTNIEMDGYTFSGKNIHFFSNEVADYPDEIAVTLVHADYKEEDRKTITNGTFIFLDNAFGELNAATMLDEVNFTGPSTDNKELISIDKLQDFLTWREKEFVEKYKGARYDTENDEHAVLKAKDANGLLLIAVVNQELLNWDAKPSHPWMMVIEVKYDATNNGMPGDETYAQTNQLVDELSKQLPDTEGYLHLGVQTYNGIRSVYYACKEFRRSSKTAAACIYKYEEKLDVSYDIYKDKYWRTMNRFMTT